MDKPSADDDDSVVDCIDPPPAEDAQSTVEADDQKEIPPNPEAAYNEVFDSELPESEAPKTEPTIATDTLLSANQLTSDMDVSHSSSSQSPNDSNNGSTGGREHHLKLDSADGSTDDSGINCDQRSEGSDNSAGVGGSNVVVAVVNRGKKRSVEEDDDIYEGRPAS